LEELKVLVDTSRKKTEREQKFAAALKGIDIDKGKNDEAVEEVQRRVAAKLQNKSEEAVKWEGGGFDYEG